MEELKKAMEEQELREAAFKFAELTEDRDSKEEEYFNPIGCSRYDSFLEGAKWMEEKINNLHNERQRNTSKDSAITKISNYICRNHNMVFNDETDIAMSDITKCSGVFSKDRLCPIRETCKRFTAPYHEFRQSMFVNPPGKWIITDNGKSRYRFECTEFWNNK